MMWRTLTGAIIKCVCFMLPFRSAEATGGTATHGGVAQSGDAEEERDAAQVFVSDNSVWL